MCRSKCDARAQVKLQSPCAGKNAMPVRRQMCDALAQVKMRCARADQNEIRMSRCK